MKYITLIFLVLVVLVGTSYITTQSPTEDIATDTTAGAGVADNEPSGDDASAIPYVPVSSYAVFVYDGISVPDDTRVLDVSNRGLSGSLKAEIRHVSALEELNISGNNFTGLPAEVGQLSELRVLNLSDNPLTGLPHELGNLKNLQVLDLRGTQYASYDLEVISAGLPSDVSILTD